MMRESLQRRNTRYHKKVEDLLHELAGLSFEALNRKPKNGGWSAGQTAKHLQLVEELGLRYVNKKLSFGGDFEKVGLSAQWRQILLLAGIYMPMKFKAPAVTSIENESGPVDFEELKDNWNKTRNDWNEFFQKMPDDLLDKAVYKHPRAGKIGWGHMLQFLDAHLERHLLQIRNAISS